MHFHQRTASPSIIQLAPSSQAPPWTWKIPANSTLVLMSKCMKTWIQQMATHLALHQPSASAWLEIFKASIHSSILTPARLSYKSDGLPTSCLHLLCAQLKHWAKKTECSATLPSVIAIRTLLLTPTTQTMMMTHFHECPLLMLMGVQE